MFNTQRIQFLQVNSMKWVQARGVLRCDTYDVIELLSKKNMRNCEVLFLFTMAQKVTTSNSAVAERPREA